MAVVREESSSSFGKETNKDRRKTESEKKTKRMWSLAAWGNRLRRDWLALREGRACEECQRMCAENSCSRAPSSGALGQVVRCEWAQHALGQSFCFSKVSVYWHCFFTYI